MKTVWQMYRFMLAGWYDERQRRTHPAKKTKPAHSIQKVIFQNL